MFQIRKIIINDYILLAMEKSVSKNLRLEKHQIRFLIREFVELQKTLKSLKEAEEELDAQKLKEDVQAILKKFRGGFLSGEERVEYKLYRNFKHLEEATEKLSAHEPDSNVKELMTQASVYNGKLAELGARGGRIEQILNGLLEEKITRPRIKNAEKLVSEAIEADLAFEETIKEIVRITQKNKVIKETLFRDVGKSRRVFHHNLALAQIRRFVLVLYDQNELEHIFQDIYERNKLKAGRGGVTTEEIAAMSERTVQYNQRITATRKPRKEDFVLGPRNINETQDLLFKRAVVGYIQFKCYHQKTQFLGAYEIFRVAALKGFGPLTLELAFCFAARDNHPVIIDRNEVSEAARKVWQRFNQRKDIIKFPESLAESPELVGYTKRKVLDIFGSLDLGSTFDKYGFPVGTRKEKLTKLLYASLPEDATRAQKERAEEKLDRGTYEEDFLQKAFYYDKNKNLFDTLIAKGEKDMKTHFQLKVDLEEAGYEFFQSFNESKI